MNHEQKQLSEKETMAPTPIAAGLRRGEYPSRPWEQEAQIWVWIGTPEDYPETNTYEYERVRI